MKNKQMTLISIVKQMLPALALALLTSVMGCKTQGHVSQTPPPELTSSQAQTHNEPIILREGDVLRITFQGNPNLDTAQPIRRDGKIALSMVGEVEAVGMTPADLQKKLVDLYSKQLVGSPEITVMIQSSAFPVFVSGAVLRPGKVMSDHPITVFEAIMEAGGPDYSKANLKSVTVIRFENNRYVNYTVNLKSLLSGGKDVEPFYLKPNDVVRVPQKFTWF